MILKFLKKLIVTIIIVFFIVVIVIVIYFYFFDFTKFDQSKIYIESTKETLYLKQIQSGLNYNAIIISPFRGRKMDKHRDYCYTWNETLFYKVEGNTVYILCGDKTEIPSKFGKKVKIIQNNYTNLEYYDLMETYNEKGYQKFPLSPIEKKRDERTRKLNGVKGQTNIYTRAIQFIKNDSVLNYKEEYDIYVSPEIIAFNLISVESSILRTDYIRNYNEFGNYNQEQRKTINKVIDSLVLAENVLNKNYQNKLNKNLNNLSTGKNIGYVLFFSDIINNKLYVEVIPYDSLTFKNYKRETVAFGKVYSYLFNLDDKGKFLKVYSGIICHN